jgi:hypothetical protein
MLEAKIAAQKRELEGKYLVRVCFTQNILPQQNLEVDSAFPLKSNKTLSETICLSG